MQADMDAVMDKRNSETHNHDKIDYPNMNPDSYAKNSKINGTTVEAEGVVTGTESEAAIMLKNAAKYMIKCEREGKTPTPEEVAEHSTTLRPGTKAYDNFVKSIRENDAMTLNTMSAGQQKTPQITQVLKFNRPPTKVCKGDPGWDLCERFASMPDPSPRTCYNGTFTPAKGACKAYTKDIQISSYTTRVPQPTKPLTKDEDYCKQNDKNLSNFETSITFNKISGTIKANQRNMQDKAQSLVTQFNEDLWTSKYQSEDRFWNPFQEGIISSGLPIKTKDDKYYTVELDSWEDREYRPNSFLPESIEYVRKKEAINDTVVRKYHGSNINIYNNAPNLWLLIDI